MMAVTHLFEYKNHDVTDIHADMSYYDSENLWNIIYERLQNKSALSCKDTSCEVARAVHNRWKNRYRDISPYDRNRVHVGLSDEDYVNASYVCIPDTQARQYILTQGPMQQTMEHFWLMVWEHRSPAIIMLNKIFERGTMRCHPYFPEENGSSSIAFKRINVSVNLESESASTNYIQRIFLLVNHQTNEQHRVHHFHFTRWPDFGVPVSPRGLLAFLWVVRASGCLDVPEHPSVIHCSAGVGRSGAFVLVDLALLLVEQCGTLKGLDLADLFVKLRHCRMGVIQTADQLRFCYYAVLHGGQRLLGTPPLDRPFIDFDDEAQPEESLPLFNDANNDDSDSTGGSNVSEDFQFHVISSSDDEEGVDESGIQMVSLATMDDDDDGDDEGLSSLQGGTRHITPECVITQRSVFSQPTVAKFGAVSVSSTQWTHPADYSFVRTPQNTVINSNAMYQFEVNDYREVSPTRNNTMNDLLSDNLATNTPFLATPVSSSTSQELSQENGVNLTKSDGNTFCGMQEVEEATGVCTCPDDTEDVVGAYQNLICASAELRDRRAARRLRHLRNIDRAKAIRQDLHSRGLGRKRWLPDWLLRHLRWFYAESGLIQSAQGAVIGSSILVTLGLTICLVAYNSLFR